MAFNYFRISEADKFSFIRVPKALMTEESFDSLSLQSKILYGMLIDRMSVSGKNQWIDEENRVYIVYPIQEIQKDMKVSKHKAIDCLAELESIGLIEKRLKGNGRAAHLYVKNFVSASREVQKLHSWKGGKGNGAEA